MTLKQKNNLIAEIIALLEKSIAADDESSKLQVCTAQNQPPEMLTVKECSQVVNGLSEHTVRQWIDTLHKNGTGQARKNSHKQVRSAEFFWIVQHNEFCWNKVFEAENLSCQNQCTHQF